MMKKIFIYIYFISTLLLAEVITSDLEYQRISGVAYTWKTVNFGNSYSDPIVVCTNVLPSKTNNEAVVRIRNLSMNSFQVKIQRPNDSDPGYSTDVYCIISDEGSYTIPFKYEAHKVLSDNTNGNSSPNNWNESRAENVSASITQTYTRPTVLGQVISYNDNRFSVFWSFDCDNRKNRPFQSGMSDGICVGKHVGQIGQTRNNETLGYIVAEAGIYELEDFSIAINYGGNSIKGIGDSPPYSYTLDKSYTHGVVTKEAENGGQGGWTVLYGASPFGTSLDMGVDEETIQGDTTRRHISEEVAYWVMLNDPITPAEMIINEVLYRQTSGNVDEFIEFYVTQSGNLKNYLFSDQDGTGDQYRFPKHAVTNGDYVVLHIGSGTDSVIGNVHHFYMGRGSNIFNDNGDDVVLYKPVNTDVTTVDGNSLSVIPVDYMAYGSGADAIPSSQLGVTVSWSGSENSRLSGADTGESIALTPNANDSDTSLCWELSATIVASKKATNCTNYIPTRDTNTNAGQTNSVTLSNTSTPNMNISKTSIVTDDGVNATNHKRIPGATIRYCFTVDNTGEGNADNVKIDDSLTGNGKDNLIYVKAGSMIQNISTVCDCTSSSMDDTKGSISGTDVTINIGTLTGTGATATSRGCAYIEMTIK
jgi:uncharacterized repeat protein (TIGR01451 family)